MEVQSTAIPEVKILRPKKHGDDRGFFSEVYSKAAFAAAGIELDFVQDNHSYSARRGVVRGLHFQVPPFAQNKLVRVVRGSVLDVAVDLRRGSPTYADYVCVLLSAEACNQILVPIGFAHGFCTLEPDTEVIYKVTAPYAADHQAGTLWDDPELAIDWPVEPGEAILSAKDKQLPCLHALPPYFHYRTAERRVRASQPGVVASDVAHARGHDRRKVCGIIEFTAATEVDRRVASGMVQAKRTVSGKGSSNRRLPVPAVDLSDKGVAHGGTDRGPTSPGGAWGRRPPRILITGGSGFIGSAFVRFLLRHTEALVINVDKLTYAASPEALAAIEADPRYSFERVDICDEPALRRAFALHRPDAVVHLAAESHVDRSIDSPAPFIHTNVLGTYTLLEVASAYCNGLGGEAQARFRFHHVSTDEVFGSLGPAGRFTETTPYRPTSPYSASKAASDHLVRAWHYTYGLPVVISNCSNNYGPYQFPEKLIPLMTINALRGAPLSVYGRGDNVRDWLHVEDHARALWTILRHGKAGETYAIGGDNEMRNVDVVALICDTLDELVPPPNGRPRRELITYVADRPGHDLRYAIDASKVRRDLGWRPVVTLATGLRKTVTWYAENRNWWQPILAKSYDGARLGLSVRGTLPSTIGVAT